MSTLIICMAGLNTRFHNVGFDIPKYLLPWKNNTIIYEILYQIKKKYTFSNYLLIANKRDRFFKKKLKKEIIKLGINSNSIHYIGDTNGQAHTAFIATKFVNNQFPIFIHNGDTILYNRDFKKIEINLKKADSYVDCFVAKNQKYSYVKKKGNKVKSIREKIRISSFASSGLYCFKNCDLYQKYYNKFAKEFNKREMYVSNIINLMIKDKLKVLTNQIKKNFKTTVLGTPEEYGLELTKFTLKK
jgi:dTDP-glucose pyrophosphorylase